MHSAGRRGGPPPTPPPAKVSLLPLELLELLEPPPPPAPLPLLLGDARGLLLLRLLLLLEGEMEAQRRILTIFFLAQSTNWREKGKRGGEMCEIHMRGEWRHTRYSTTAVPNAKNTSTAGRSLSRMTYIFRILHIDIHIAEGHLG